MLLEETYDGIVRPFDPDKKLLGAVNRENVTCYLDALLFAMFARLDSFEAMLYDSFEDMDRRKLAGMLRLWVNLLRTGRVIPTDVTKQLQEALSACGWPDAAKLKQQDPSEAFCFITGKLELPLLTLKMDLYHTGREDPQDDHKFVNERLLEVAIPDKPSESNAIITLEDCLEHYFNNRIEVKRHLQEQRRNTLKQSEVEEKGEAGLHVEVAELTTLTETPVSTPLSETPTSAKTIVDKLRPSIRSRADSIFSQRKIELHGIDPEKTAADQKLRKMSTRTEVLMPAWQFFKLLPWYTDNMPTSDAQVAAHFSKKRPVLGICLKRYSYTNTGKAQKRDTHIDIPLEIAVPNFVSDDNMDDGAPLMGNFRLLLQSVVCHRGLSVHSGHYICLSRGTASNAVRTSSPAERSDSDSDSDMDDPWMRFDDLAKERITYVDIQQALKDETPYLLFYQVQPVDEDGRSIHDLPSYAEATSRGRSEPTLAEKSDLEVNSDLGSADLTSARGESEAVDFALSSQRTSLDQPSPGEAPRGRSSMSVLRDDRRASVSFDDRSFAGSLTTSSVPTDAASSSVPATPSDEKPSSFLSVIGGRRGSRPSKSRSRPVSNGPDTGSGRFSLNMAKLTAKMSRGEAAVVEGNGPTPELPALTESLSSEKSPAVVSSITLAADSKEAVITSTKILPEKGKKSKTSRKADRKTAQDDRECTLM